MLAGLVQAPSRFAPTRHYDRAKRRMDLVKGAMVAAGYLTEAEARAMPYPAVDSRTRKDLPTGTYFADWVLPEARDQAGEIKAGHKPDNFLQPANLPDFERSHLRDAFVVVRSMQSALGQGKGIL